MRKIAVYGQFYQKNAEVSIEILLNFLLNKDEILSADNNLNSDISSNILITPNPASSIISIDAEGFKSDAELRLYSLQDQLIKKLNLNSGKASLQVEDLTSGIYLIRITDDNGKTGTRKLMIN